MAFPFPAQFELTNHIFLVVTISNISKHYRINYFIHSGEIVETSYFGFPLASSNPNIDFQYFKCLFRQTSSNVIQHLGYYMINLKMHAYSTLYSIAVSFCHIATI